MVLPTMVEWEHEGTASTVVVAATSTASDIVGDVPTGAVAQDGVAVLQVACKPSGTFVGHPQNHLQKELT
jgi:hypothetical protein